MASRIPAVAPYLVSLHTDRGTFTTYVEAPTRMLASMAARDTSLYLEALRGRYGTVDKITLTRQSHKRIAA